MTVIREGGKMTDDKDQLEDVIEVILRDHIRIIQDDARRDTRTFRITGYRSAARELAAMIAPKPEKPDAN
jgi:hypothetical protein